MSDRDPSTLLARAATAEVSGAALGEADRFRGMRFAGVSRREALRVRRESLAARSRARHPVSSHKHDPIGRPTSLRTEMNGPQPTAEELAFLHQVFRLANLPLARYRLAPLARRLSACLRAIKAST